MSSADDIVGRWEDAQDLARREEITRLSARVKELETELSLLKDAYWKDKGIIASTTDLANTWARESGIPEGRPKSLKDLIDRLWSFWSHKAYQHLCRAEKAEARLAQAEGLLREAGVVRWCPHLSNLQSEKDIRNYVLSPRAQS